VTSKDETNTCGTSGNQLDWTVTYNDPPTENVTLHKLYDKITDIETKVDLIVDYLGVNKMKTVNRQTDHATATTAPLVDNGEQKEPILSPYMTPTLKERAEVLSSSKRNLSKNLLLELSKF